MEDAGVLAWHETLPLAEIPTERGISHVVGDERIALFRVGDRVYALRDLCPHQGALLSKGDVLGDGDDKGDPPVVICPVHYWEFSLEDGVSPDDPDYQACTFPVRIENGQVLVGLRPTDRGPR